MARFSRIQVALKLEEAGLLPLFNHHDIEVLKNIVKASYQGGIRIMEFTNRGDFTHELFSELNKYVIKEFPDLILGVGTVIDAGTASLYIQVGANFILSPALHEEVGKVCNRRKVLWVPGCASASEISKAEELGAEIIKIFPATLLGGPKFVAAIKGPCPWTSMIATGGVTTDEDNLKEWFNAGVHSVGMSQIISSEDVENGQFQNIENKCREVLNTIRSIRKNK
ncbi:MAG: bifunctional 4-hydroxy-2-oxoglutarate aldolase/2-dehydro-3-deoxy-phosphogluconate aldolase [Bacteroidota bacterium]|nr:bifunctional 4-hydroxy-2-oxoglutarate aldolase/2-dehydro-3-deoxy-phosphogluconate aldolase [Bacteroidota bacterium]